MRRDFGPETVRAYLVGSTYVHSSCLLRLICTLDNPALYAAASEGQVTALFSLHPSNGNSTTVKKISFLPRSVNYFSENLANRY